MVCGRRTEAPSGLFAKRFRFSGRPAASATMPMGSISVAGRVALCRLTQRAAMPPPATMWHGSSVSGTNASNWSDA